MLMRAVLTILFLLVLQVGVSVSAQEKKPEKIVSAVKAEEPNPIEISVNENRITVANVPVGSKLEIYSVVGIKVKEIEMKQPAGEYLLNIAKGYYIVRIGETVRKIAVR